ncbi:MAG: hypothetical protein RLZ98_315 [Pseudomonadota bacterium]|jgi:hypothetical protein
MAAPAPHSTPMTNVLALPSGTRLAGDFRIERVLGAGGFGITYLARDLVLDRAVTIKEYFPVDFAARGGSNDAVPRSHDCVSDYEWGLDRFIEEAKTLAQFDHRYIVKVFRYFQENSTAYMVLQFEEGRSLKAWQKGLRRAPRQGELDQIVAPLLEALEVIHAADFLHRDIAPDNIIIRTDGSPVLIDFGSARGDIARHSRTVSALVKPGYSPYEQYAETGSQQGPWTDIYALGATLYHVVTGRRPPDSPSRIVKDEYVSAGQAALGNYRPGFVAAIDHALRLDIEMRPRSVAQWRGELLAPGEKASIRLFRRKEPVPAAPPVELAPTIRLPEPAAALGAAATIPPPPDAPVRQGGFLDFVDGLKRNRQPRAKVKEAASLAEALKIGAPPEAAPAPPEPAKRKTLPPDARPERQKARRRPRGVRRAGQGLTLRSLLFKLLIGAGVAAFAVNYQHQLPRVASISTGTVEKRVVARPPPAPPKEPEVRLPAPLRAHQGAVRAIAFAGNRSELVSAGIDGQVKRWNATTGALLGTIVLDSPPTSVAVRDGRIVTGHGDGRVALWNEATGERIASFRHNEAPVWSVAFADNASRVLAAGHDWKIRLWDVASPAKPVHVFEDHENAVQTLGIAKADPAFVSGGADKTVKLWDLANLELVRTYRGHRDFVTSVAISPDGRRVAGADLKGRIRVWSTQSSKLLRIFGRHSERVSELAFSPSSDMLASASADGTVRLWQLSSKRPYRALPAGAEVNAIAFAPDGRSIVAATADGMLRFFPTRRSED